MLGGPLTGTPRAKQARSDDTSSSMATLYDAWVTAKGKFGQGLAFDKSSDDGRMKIEPNGIPLKIVGGHFPFGAKIYCPLSDR